MKLLQLDPRGRTLDVIVAAKPKGSGGQKVATNSNDNEDETISVAVKSIVLELGVSLEEAKCLSSAKGDYQVKNGFWSALCQLTAVESNLFDPAPGLTEDEQESNKQIALEEVEVLKAIFPEEKDLQLTTFMDSQNLSVTQLLVPLSSSAGENQIMCVHYYDGSYPMKHPKVLVTGGWNSANPGSTVLHSELIKFVSTLPNDEPMVFEVFNYAQELLQTSENMKVDQETSLLPYLSGGERFQIKPPKTKSSKQGGQRSSRNRRELQNPVGFKSRPRTKSYFWSKLPKETPPAEAFPKLRTIIDNARKRLPAAAAREEFLSVMQEADRRDRVLLVTGETGKCRIFLEFVYYIYII